MIIDLPDTSVSSVAKRLVSVREEGGAVALGRVLTLIIKSTRTIDETVIEAANDASREHPMRVIVLVTEPDGEPRLDAEIRVGGDAGASEVIVLRAHGAAASNEETLISGLLLPDAPVVVWWPEDSPVRPGIDQLGRIAQRRITDTAKDPHPSVRLRQLDLVYTPGDTDLAWTRLTRWREHLAAVLDQPPFEPVTSVEVRGSSLSPSTMLLAAWLGTALDAPTTVVELGAEEWDGGIQSVHLRRQVGDIVLERHSQSEVTLTQPGQPVHELVLPRRTLRECLAEELRRLDEDVTYGSAIAGIDLTLRDADWSAAISTTGTSRHYVRSYN